MMETLEQKITKIKAEHDEKVKSEIACAEIQIKLFEATGLPFSVVHYNKSKNDFGAYVENSGYKGKVFERKEIEKYMRSIVKALDLKPVNDRFGFASKEEIPMTLNVRVTIDNNVNELCFYHPTTAEIRFKFEGITIAFKSSVHEIFSVDNLYTEQAVHPDDRHKTKKRRTKTYYSLRGFKTVGYYGGSAVTGCVQESRNDEFLEVLYNGYPTE